MGRIIKALILGWIGKKIYDRVSADDRQSEHAREQSRAGKPSSSHVRRKTTRRKDARAA